MSCDWFEIVCTVLKSRWEKKKSKRTGLFRGPTGPTGPIGESLVGPIGPTGPIGATGGTESQAISVAINYMKSQGTTVLPNQNTPIGWDISILDINPDGPTGTFTTFTIPLAGWMVSGDFWSNMG